MPVSGSQLSGLRQKVPENSKIKEAWEVHDFKKLEYRFADSAKIKPLSEVGYLTQLNYIPVIIIDLQIVNMMCSVYELVLVQFEIQI